MSSKEVRALLRELRRQGWRVTRAGSGHHIAVSPHDGARVVIPSTPSSRGRWRLNALAKLRRHGFNG